MCVTEGQAAIDGIEVCRIPIPSQERHCTEAAMVAAYILGISQVLGFPRYDPIRGVGGRTPHL